MSDRPPFHQVIQEQLEIAAKHIDAKYWHALKPFQIEYTGPETLSPPKTPVLLRNELTMYAGALFRLEGDQYPKQDGSYRLWLLALSKRISARILRTVEELEASEGKATLSYHGLSMEAIRENIEVFLAIVVYEYTGVSVPVMPLPPRAETQKQTKQLTSKLDSEVTRRVALLNEYKAANGHASNRRIYLAQNSSIHKPQFYQWLDGTLSTTSETTLNFERFLRSKRPPIPPKPKPKV